jgi:peptide/nickel transport system substrate-binding protein
VHPPSVQKYGNRGYSTDPKKFVGTGPYKPVDLEPNVTVRLQRHEEWWGPKPDFQEIVFRRYDRSAGGSPQLNALLSGELDVAFALPGDRRDEVSRATGISSKFFPTFVLNYFWINHTFPLFKDELIRQAIAFSYDRVKFNEATYGPTVIPQSKFWFPGSPYLNDSADVAYDPQKVKALMEQAGFKTAADGVWTKPDGTRAEFKLQYRAQPGAPAPVEHLFWQQGLKDQGFDVELQVFDPGLPFSRDGGGVFDKKNLQVSNTGVAVTLGDPSFGMQRWTIDEPFNFSWMDDPDMNRLFVEQNKEIDQTKRIALVKQMQAIAAKLIPGSPPACLRTEVPGNRTRWRMLRAVVISKPSCGRTRPFRCK